MKKTAMCQFFIIMIVTRFSTLSTHDSLTEVLKEEEIFKTTEINIYLIYLLTQFKKEIKQKYFANISEVCLYSHSIPTVFQLCNSLH